MFLLAQSTATHAAVNSSELEVSIQDVRMALQDRGAFAPEKVEEDEDFDDDEDMRGVENFLAWSMGKVNKEIRRVALEGGDGKEDYLTGLPSVTGAPWSHANTFQFLRRSTVLLMKNRDTLALYWARQLNPGRSRWKEGISPV